MSPRGTRGLSRIVAALLLVVVIAAAAGVYFLATGEPGSQASSASSKPSATSASLKNGSVVIGTVGQIGKTIDPAVAADGPATNLIRNINDGLIDLRPGTSQPIPALASNWTSSDGGLRWDFNLRRGVAFLDGVQFNASLEAYSLNRSMNFDRGSFAGHGLDRLIANVSVTGPFQIQISLNHPADVSFATDTSLDPVDPRVVGNGGAVNFTGTVSTEDPNGLGPYVLKSWTKLGGQDDSVGLAANPSYWNATSGYPKETALSVRFFGDKTSLLGALSASEVDLAYVDPSSGGLQSADVRAFSSNASFIVWTGPSAFGGIGVVVSTNSVVGVVVDPTGIMRYFTIFVR